MARCGCSGTSCSCVVVGSGGITVTGSGSGANPYVISGGGSLSVTDTPTLDLSLTGDGSSTTPYLLSGVANVAVGDLTDVDDSAKAAGKVLAVNGTGDGYVLITAPTAAPGAITVAGGVDGDGSAGDPLTLLLDGGADSGLVQSASGVKVKGSGPAAAYAPIWTASTSAPALGSGSLTGRYVEYLNLVWLNIELIVGTTTARGTGVWSFSLPVTPFASRSQELAASVRLSTGEVYAGVAVLDGSNTVQVYISTSSKADPVSNSVPIALPTGSTVSITGTYERGL